MKKPPRIAFLLLLHAIEIVQVQTQDANPGCVVRIDTWYIDKLNSKPEEQPTHVQMGTFITPMAIVTAKHPHEIGKYIAAVRLSFGAIVPGEPDLTEMAVEMEFMAFAGRIPDPMHEWVQVWEGPCARIFMFLSWNVLNAVERHEALQDPHRTNIEFELVYGHDRYQEQIQRQLFTLIIVLKRLRASEFLKPALIRTHDVEGYDSSEECYYRPDDRTDTLMFTKTVVDADLNGRVDIGDLGTGMFFEHVDKTKPLLLNRIITYYENLSKRRSLTYHLTMTDVAELDSWQESIDEIVIPQKQGFVLPYYCDDKVDDVYVVTFLAQNMAVTVDFKCTINADSRIHFQVETNHQDVVSCNESVSNLGLHEIPGRGLMIMMLPFYMSVIKYLQPINVHINRLLDRTSLYTYVPDRASRQSVPLESDYLYLCKDGALPHLLLKSVNIRFKNYYVGAPVLYRHGTNPGTLYSLMGESDHDRQVFNATYFQHDNSIYADYIDSMLKATKPTSMNDVTNAFKVFESGRSAKIDVKHIQNIERMFIVFNQTVVGDTALGRSLNTLMTLCNQVRELTLNNKRITVSLKEQMVKVKKVLSIFFPINGPLWSDSESESESEPEP